MCECVLVSIRRTETNRLETSIDCSVKTRAERSKRYALACAVAMETIATLSLQEGDSMYFIYMRGGWVLSPDMYTMRYVHESDFAQHGELVFSNPPEQNRYFQRRVFKAGSCCIKIV